MGNVLQQYALLYTDVANTAVFTIFYVILVPFVAYYFFQKIFINLFGYLSLFVYLEVTEFDNIQVR